MDNGAPPGATLLVPDDATPKYMKGLFCLSVLFLEKSRKCSHSPKTEPYVASMDNGAPPGATLLVPDDATPSGTVPLVPDAAAPDVAPPTSLRSSPVCYTVSHLC
jgi:hypothetical protein